MEEKKLNTSGELSGSDKVQAEAYDWIETFCRALFAVVIIFTFFFRFVTVDGQSMNETLQHGDRLIITSTAYTPQRGDIVVVHDVETKGFDGDNVFEGPIIKRVIATEGEKVVIDCDNWTITVTDTDGNVVVLNEPYVNFEYDGAGNLKRMLDPSQYYGYPNAIGNLVEHTVAEGCVFVCGDNRNHSLDSRFVGDIDERKILGKVLIRILPFSGFGTFEKPAYAN